MKQNSVGHEVVSLTHSDTITSLQKYKGFIFSHILVNNLPFKLGKVKQNKLIDLKWSRPCTKPTSIKVIQSKYKYKDVVMRDDALTPVIIGKDAEK